MTVALLAGVGGTATATIDSDAASYIGPIVGSAATNVTTTSGVLNLLVTSSQIATATVTGGGGGGVTSVPSTPTPRCRAPSRRSSETARPSRQPAASSSGQTSSTPSPARVDFGSGGVVTSPLSRHRQQQRHHPGLPRRRRDRGHHRGAGQRRRHHLGDRARRSRRHRQRIRRRRDPSDCLRLTPSRPDRGRPRRHVDGRVPHDRGRGDRHDHGLRPARRVTPANDRINSVSVTGDTLTFTYPGIVEGSQVQYSGTAAGINLGGRTPCSMAVPA